MTKKHDKGHKGQMSDREVMQQALDFLESGMPSDLYGMDKEQHQTAIAALRQALEQPDPVEAAVLAEREACAKVCEVEASVIVTNASEQYQEGRAMGVTVCAEAIRARGE